MSHMPRDSADSDEQRRKAELTRRYKAAQQEQQIRAYMRKILEPAAYERLMNVRVSNHDLYMQIVQVIINIVQSNSSVKRITEQQLMDLVGRMTSSHQPTIEFKRK